LRLGAFAGGLMRGLFARKGAKTQRYYFTSLSPSITTRATAGMISRLRE